MNKITEYLTEFNKESRDKFIFGLIIHNKPTKENIYKEIKNLGDVAEFDNCIDNESEIIENIKLGKIVVVNTNGNITDNLYKFLWSIFNKDPGTYNESIKKSSIIFLVDSRDYNDFETNDLEFYTCNISTTY